jgi:large subunit ribosomal protein L32
MAVPKKKISKSRRNMRRSHHALKATNITVDATTGELKLSHHISIDGYYRGRQVLTINDNTEAQETDQESA